MRSFASPRERACAGRVLLTAAALLAVVPFASMASADEKQGIVLFLVHGKGSSTTGGNRLHPSQGRSPLTAGPLLRF